MYGLNGSAKLLNVIAQTRINECSSQYKTRQDMKTGLVTTTVLRAWVYYTAALARICKLSVVDRRELLALCISIPKDNLGASDLSQTHKLFNNNHHVMTDSMNNTATCSFVYYIGI